jgi:hypothetical protein
MPILRKQDVIEFNREAMNRLNHRIAIRNRQRTARAEIVLYVDDDEGVVRGNFHTGHYRFLIPYEEISE